MITQLIKISHDQFLITISMTSKNTVAGSKLDTQVMARPALKCHT